MIIKFKSKQFQIDLSNPIVAIKAANENLGYEIKEYDKLHYNVSGWKSDRLILDLYQNVSHYVTGDKYDLKSSDHWEIIPEESDMKVQLFEFNDYPLPYAYVCGDVAYYGNYKEDTYMHNDKKSFEKYRDSVILPYIKYKKEVNNSLKIIRDVLDKESARLESMGIYFHSTDHHFNLFYENDEFGLEMTIYK